VSERVVGIELAGDEIRVAKLVRRGRATTMEVERQGPAVRGGTPPASRARAIAALPLAATTHRVVALPFADERTIAQVVPLELRGQLPTDVPDAEVGFEVLARDGRASRVLGMLARRADLERAAAAARDTGATLAGVTAAPLALRWLLPQGFDGTVLVADGPRTSVALWDAGRLRTMRALAADARDGGAVARELAWCLPLLADPAPDRLAIAGPDATPTFREALARAGIETEPLVPLVRSDFQAWGGAIARDPVACALVAGALAGAPALPFPREPEKASPLTPRARHLLVAAAALAVLHVGIARLDLARRDAALERAIRAEAGRVLPGESLVAPRTQLEAAVAAARRSHTALTYGTALARLREVSARIPEGLPIDLARLTVEGERLQLVGDSPTFESVDVLRRALVASPRLRDVTTDEVRTAVDGRRVSFRLRARWVPYGEAPSGRCGCANGSWSGRRASAG
jgi:hypothetical protein